eukprot:gene5794-9022_t
MVGTTPTQIVGGTKTTTSSAAVPVAVAITAAAALWTVRMSDSAKSATGSGFRLRRIFRIVECSVFSGVTVANGTKCIPTRRIHIGGVLLSSGWGYIPDSADCVSHHSILGLLVSAYLCSVCVVGCDVPALRAWLRRLLQRARCCCDELHSFNTRSLDFLMSYLASLQDKVVAD